MNGHEVDIAMDGVTALRTAAESPPDVVLLDIGIPLMDGYQLARQLRQLPTSKRPFLIALTGHALEQDRRCSFEAGIDLHFLKPLDFKRLQGLLARFQQVVGPEV
jgi:CheY-like chemotaxis protein